MPHDACSVKLRPGATSPRNVKLYPWTVAGSLDITSLESGVGADVIHVYKAIVVLDAGAGSESVLKQLRIIVIVTDAGTGSEALTLQKPQIEALSSELRFYLTQLREVKTIEAILRVHAIVVDEGRLSVSGEPWNVEDAFIYGVGLSENLRSVKLGDQHEVTPRLGSAQSIPRGWNQGHKSHPISVFTNGRSSILDEYLAESGDSSEIELLDLRCLDKDGLPSNIFLKNAVVVRADPLALEGGDIVYRYDLVCDHWTMRPEMHVLKMVQKPVSAPLTITMIHPEVKPYSSNLDVDVLQDFEAILEAASELRFFPEQIREVIKTPSVGLAFYLYDGHVWLISAAVSEYGSLDFAGWEAMESGSPKSVTASADTSNGYVIANASPFILDGEAGLGEVDEYGAASFTIPAQVDDSAHQIDCGYAEGWGLYAKHTTSNGYHRVSPGYSVSARAYQSSISPPPHYHVEWYLDGAYVGSGGGSPEIPAQVVGSYHTLDSAQVTD